MNNKWVNRSGKILLAITLIIIIKMLYDQDINIGDYVNTWQKVVIMSIVIAIYIVCIFINARVYYKVLSIFSNQKINRNEISNVYITSNLGKYLPGNIMHFVGRNVLGVQYNISQSNMLLATILEVAITLITAFMLTIIFSAQYFLTVFKLLIMDYKKIVVALSVGVLVVLCLGIILIYKHRRKVSDIIGVLGTRENKSCILQGIGLSLGTQIASGVTYILVVVTIYNDSVSLNISLIGIYLLAWLVGFIMPGVPGGIGIKESILILLLNGLLPKDIILVSVIIHRCLNIIAEVLAFVIMKVIFRKRDIVED